MALIEAILQLITGVLEGLQEMDAGQATESIRFDGILCGGGTRYHSPKILPLTPSSGLFSCLLRLYCLEVLTDGTTQYSLDIQFVEGIHFSVSEALLGGYRRLTLRVGLSFPNFPNYFPWIPPS